MGIISSMLYSTIIAAGGIVEKKFSKYTKEAVEINKATLLNIINHNNSCEFGKKYNFKSIGTIEEFQRNVPLTDYSFYSSYINRMIEGEKNILMTDNVEYFGHTSGTTGSQKLIPVTKKSRMIASKYMALLMQKLAYNNFRYSLRNPMGLLVADIVSTTYTKDGTPICSATSGGMNGMKHIIPYLYSSPIDVMYIEDKNAALYLHLLFALKKRNLTYMGSVFISNVLDLLRQLEINSTDLVNDIRKGTLKRDLSITDEQRQNIKRLLTPDAGRASEIENEFSKGFDGICRRLWPGISYVACVTGGAFTIYEDKVNYYTGNLPIYSPSLAATEGMMGINPYGSKIRYVILPDTLFYEFIPIEESYKASPSVLTMDKLKKSEVYEIVITNYSGLYRYRIGDVIKVTGFYNKSPEIEFLYRKNQLLNMAGEKTSEDQMSQALKNTTLKYNLHLTDYTAIADNSKSPGRYTVFMEFKDGISPEQLKAMEKSLDKELQLSNLVYGRFRKGHRLSPVKVVILKPDTFNEIKKVLYKKGISKNQIKIPRVVTTNKTILEVIKRNTI